MTRLRIVFLAPFLSLACGGDDGTGDDGTDSTPTPSTADDGGSETAAPDDGATTPGVDDGGSDTTGTPGDDGAEPGPPEIVSVSWTNVPGCAMNVGSDVTFTIEVTDPDDDVSELTFSGMAIGCTGTFDGPMVTLFCPNAATYNATVEVADPDGNEDDLDLMFMPCVDGSAP